MIRHVRNILDRRRARRGDIKRERVFVRCPNTDQLIPAMVQLNRNELERFKRQALDLFVECPHCGVHLVSDGPFWLESDVARVVVGVGAPNDGEPFFTCVATHQETR